MRRAQAILVIVALLSGPLLFLAPPVSADMSSCCGMCCLPRHGHNSRTHDSGSQTQKHQGGACEHSATGQMANCAMNCGRAAPDYGLLSPMAPTKPSSLASISRLILSKAVKLQPTTQNISAGFLSSPFQPPRA